LIGEVAVEVDVVGVGPPVGVNAVGINGADQVEIDVARQCTSAQVTDNPLTGALVTVDAADDDDFLGCPREGAMHHRERPAVDRRADAERLLDRAGRRLRTHQHGRGPADKAEAECDSDDRSAQVLTRHAGHGVR